jgi:hypothetical protein
MSVVICTQNLSWYLLRRTMHNQENQYSGYKSLAKDTRGLRNGSVLCHCYITLPGLSSSSAITTPYLFHYLPSDRIHTFGICFYWTISTYPSLTRTFVLLFYVYWHGQLINVLVVFLLTPIIFFWILLYVFVSHIQIIIVSSSLINAALILILVGFILLSVTSCSVACNLFTSFAHFPCFCNIE